MQGKSGKIGKNGFITFFERRPEEDRSDPSSVENRPILVMLDEFPRIGKVPKIIDGLLTRDDFEEANNRYSTQLATLKKHLFTLKLGNKTVETLQQKLDNIEAAIENLARLKEFGDSICGEVLHKVVVEGREKITYYLKTDKNADMFVKMPVSVSQYCPQKQSLQSHCWEWASALCRSSC
ncbi:MAG: hypothetical protein LBH79_07390 [Nitrososphaerota archaeon]|nr:hypothetical protein [Nitrososphaerota archaeon]